MSQSAKFIDVTRTYIPIDPNAFPESLHGATREDSPEQKVPVSAYKGYNFLPTSYGYKSYFGTAAKLGIDALATRVDHIFVYQNKGFENILIALTETGIWIKKGEAAGAWTNVIGMSAPQLDTIHFDWSFCIVADILYTYRQGFASYQKIVHDSVVGIVASNVVPNFLNMPAQVGVFKAAGRLAFWDSADSSSWANLDDFADFTPSLETLAGNARFIDIQGRIVTIKSHGPGFLIYSTKSILYIQQDSQNLYQWKPTVVCSNVGITYPRQAVEASPDTIHFAYTTEGMKKIEMAKAETIITEVTDFFAEYDKPVYLKVLEGRYLFLEVLDDDYLVGNVQISDAVVPAIDYVFPGSNVTIDNADPVNEGISSCITIAGLNSGALAQPPSPADKKPGTLLKPIWTCYLSRNGVVDPESIVFTGVPCPTVDPNGIEKNLCPSIPTVTALTQTTAGKKTVTGDQAYLSGGWTMERFVQAQTAIWEIEEKALAAVISKITNRTGFGTKVTNNATDLTAFVRNECTIGRFASKFSPAKFGYSACQFWLTRFCTEAIDLVRVKANQITGVIAPEEYSLWRYNSINSSSGFVYASQAAAIAAGTPFFVSDGKPAPYTSSTRPSVSPNTGAILTDWLLSPGEPDAATPPSTISVSRTITKFPDYQNTENMNAYNKGVPVAAFPVAVESPYCEITGYSYTKADGSAGIAAAAPCAAGTSYPKTGGTKPGGMPLSVSTKDGTYCGKPYIPPVIEGVTINWPSETVTIPPSSFLMQVGSIAPVYPTMAGALVYDLQLKKWGKMRGRYKQLLDYSPLNSTVTGNVPFSTFGILAGVFTEDGKVAIFDSQPTDSYISYGKIGYYRLGMTSPEEVHAHFRTLSTGYIKVETALEGNNLAAGLVIQQNFTAVNKVSLFGAYPGKWCNIEIGGIFDINYLEYRGFINGRR